MNLILLFETDFLNDSRKTVRLAGHRMKHILTVCKVTTGQSLKAGLFGGLMGSALVTTIKDQFIELEVNLDKPPPPALPLILLLSLPRPKSLKKSIEVATTLGIKKIYLMESWKVEKSYWSSPVLTEDSLNIHIFQGLEQARDTIPPQIHIRRRFKPFLQDEIPQLVSGSQALVAHPYNGILCPHSLNSNVVLAIGPEGGFTPYEIELFGIQGFQTVTLGDRILRVEQAIPALASRLF